MTECVLQQYADPYEQQTIQMCLHTCNSRPGSKDSDTAAFQALHHLLASHQQKKLCGPIGPDVILHAMTPACHASITLKPAMGRLIMLHVYLLITHMEDM